MRFAILLLILLTLTVVSQENQTLTENNSINNGGDGDVEELLSLLDFENQLLEPGDGDGDGDWIIPKGRNKTYVQATTTSRTTTSQTTTTTLGGEESYLKQLGFIPRKYYENVSQEKKDIIINESGQQFKVCGGSKWICNVEYKLNLEKKPECCTQENNPTCDLCYTQCTVECGKKNQGLESCFIIEENLKCQCTEKEPTCYDIEDLGIPKSVMAEKEKVTVQEQTNPMSKTLIFLFMIIIVVGIYYVFSKMK